MIRVAQPKVVKTTGQQFFPEKKKIIVENLWHKDKDFRWKYVDYAEGIVQNTMAEMFNIGVGGRTEGYAPEYDYYLGGKKIEQKISKNEGLELEFARYDGTPSGLSLTESDYYITVSPASSLHGSEWVKVGKVRMYKTSDLFRILGPAPEDSPFRKVYEPHPDRGPGSQVLSFSEKDLKTLTGSLGVKKNPRINIACLEVGLLKDKGKVVGFDFNFPEYCGNRVEEWLKPYTKNLFK
jgi:hypothetical protein